MIARIAKAISLGLTDQETSDLVGIQRDTLLEWKKDSEFSGAIKSAVAARLVKRLERIENGANDWHGCAWLMERLMPWRYAKPEVQISLHTRADASGNRLTLTLGLEEAQRLSRESERDVEAARKLVEEYRQRRNGQS